MVKPASWLSVTPEPERELPGAVATLRSGSPATDAAVAEESALIERLVLHGNERRWHGYLHDVVSLIEKRAGDADPSVAHAREIAIAVISNHHNLLLALPGRGARRTETDRRRLSELLATTTSNEEQV
ncbi:MAG TPA: hypothetical protein VMB27_25395 [Solirubrobacteraceae bacterium]|nr:hypothetical protein [Solirubrobacteraceae bacterium]